MLLVNHWPTSAINRTINLPIEWLPPPPPPPSPPPPPPPRLPPSPPSVSLSPHTVPSPELPHLWLCAARYSGTVMAGWLTSSSCATLHDSLITVVLWYGLTGLMSVALLKSTHLECNPSFHYNSTILIRWFLSNEIIGTLRLLSYHGNHVRVGISL